MKAFINHEDFGEMIEIGEFQLSELDELVNGIKKYGVWFEARQIEGRACEYIGAQFNALHQRFEIMVQNS